MNSFATPSATTAQSAGAATGARFTTRRAVRAPAAGFTVGAAPPLTPGSAAVDVGAPAVPRPAFAKLSTPPAATPPALPKGVLYQDQAYLVGQDANGSFILDKASGQSYPLPDALAQQVGNLPPGALAKLIAGEGGGAAPMATGGTGFAGTPQTFRDPLQLRVPGLADGGTVTAGDPYADLTEEQINQMLSGDIDPEMRAGLLGRMNTIQAQKQQAQQVGASTMEAPPSQPEPYSAAIENIKANPAARESYIEALQDWPAQGQIIGEQARQQEAKRLQAEEDARWAPGSTFHSPMELMDLPAKAVRAIPYEQSLPSFVRTPLETAANILPFVLGGEATLPMKVAQALKWGALQYGGSEAGKAVGAPDLPVVGNVGGLAAIAGAPFAEKLGKAAAGAGGRALAESATRPFTEAGAAMDRPFVGPGRGGAFNEVGGGSGAEYQSWRYTPKSNAPTAPGATDEMASSGSGFMVNRDALGLPSDSEISTSLASAKTAGAQGKFQGQQEVSRIIAANEAPEALDQIARAAQDAPRQTAYDKARLASLMDAHGKLLDYDPQTGNSWNWNSLVEGKPQLPGMETAAGSFAKLPAPEMGSMQPEGFRGEQGGMQQPAFSREETGQTGQMGMEEALPQGDFAPSRGASGLSEAEQSNYARQLEQSVNNPSQVQAKKATPQGQFNIEQQRQALIDAGAVSAEDAAKMSRGDVSQMVNQLLTKVPKGMGGGSFTDAAQVEQAARAQADARAGTPTDLNGPLNGAPAAADTTASDMQAAMNRARGVESAAPGTALPAETAGGPPPPSAGQPGAGPLRERLGESVQNGTAEEQMGRAMRVIPESEAPAPTEAGRAQQGRVAAEAATHPGVVAPITDEFQAARKRVIEANAAAEANSKDVIEKMMSAVSPEDHLAIDKEIEQNMLDQAAALGKGGKGAGGAGKGGGEGGGPFDQNPDWAQGWEPGRVKQAESFIRSWTAQTRAETDGMSPETLTGINRIVEQAMGGTVQGNMGDSYLTTLAIRQKVAVQVLSETLDPKTAHSLADQLVQRELDNHYGSNFVARGKAEAAFNELQARVEAVNQDQTLQGALTFVDRFKTSVYGFGNLHVFFVQVLNSLRADPADLFLGVVNRTLSALHAPFARDLWLDSDLPVTMQMINAGLGVRDISASGIRPTKGTLLSYVPDLGPKLDKPVAAAIGKLTDFQFNTVLGGIRKLIMEGDLYRQSLMGADLTNRTVIKNAADLANNATSFAHTALQPGRAAAEQGLAVTASMTRAQIGLVNQMTKLIQPGASMDQRQSAAILILSQVGYTLLLGKLINDHIGSGDFNMIPGTPGFGQITLPWKDPQGHNRVIGMFPQASFENAIAGSIQALSQGDPKMAATAWAKYGVQRGSVFTNMLLGGVGGVGYGDNGSFHMGDLPGKNRLMNALPIPLVAQPAVQGRTDLGTFGLHFTGLNEFPERRGVEVDRTLKGVPAAERTDSAGNVVDKWSQLTTAQQNDISRNHPEVAAVVNQKRAENPTAVGQIEQGKTDAVQQTWDKFAQTGNGKDLRVGLHAAADEARIRIDQALKDNPKSYPLPEGDRTLLDDYFKNVMDKAGKDFNLRDRLDAEWRSQHDASVNNMVDKNLLTASVPGYQAEKEAAQYVQSHGYWRSQDESNKAYADLRATSTPESPMAQFKTLDDLQAAAADRSDPRFVWAGRLLQAVDARLNKGEVKARIDNPTLDADVYLLQYSTRPYVFSQEARSQVLAWAVAHGVKIAPPLVYGSAP